VLSTHILPEVQATCSRVLIINEGKVVAIDQLDAISASLKKGTIVSVIAKGDAGGVATKLRTVDGVSSVIETGPADGGIRFSVSLEESAPADVRAALAEAVVKSGAGLLELKRETLSLEDVFLKLTTTEQ
jgi:ABC-2 type transport system ATP-binding protein